LKDFFNEGEDPVFIVGNLTAEQLARSKESETKNNAGLGKLVGTLVYSNEETKAGILADIVEAYKTKVPDELVRRQDALYFGSILPKFEDRSDVVFFARNHPITFYNLTNEIFNLTDLGALSGKSKPIGETKT